jgi:hypothetical protein
MKWILAPLVLILLLLSGPVAVAVSDKANIAGDWRLATRESSGLAPSPASTREAVVQVYGARAFRWRGAFAVHTWISVKPENAPEYTTYEVVGWRAFHGGSAVQIHNDGPDRFWFGARPELYADLRGEEAARAIRNIEKASKDYPYQDFYRTWPGPNSNTFVAFITKRVPELTVDLPPTAIGKDFLPDGSLVGSPPSGRGLQLSLFGVLGFIVSPEEGLEFNVLGLSFGVDPAELALRLPGIGKVGP